MFTAVDGASQLPLDLGLAFGWAPHAGPVEPVLLAGADLSRRWYFDGADVVAALWMPRARVDAGVRWYRFDLTLGLACDLGRTVLITADELAVSPLDASFAVGVTFP